MPLAGSWLFWAVLSAVFAAMTAILAKVGVAQVDPDFATLLRTLVIASVLALIVATTGKFQAPSTIPTRNWVFLVLSGLATGASWVCYFRALKLGQASRVAPVDKLSVVFVALLGFALLGERLAPGAWAGVGLIAAGGILVALS